MSNETIALIVTGILGALGIFGLLVYVLKSSKVLESLGDLLKETGLALEDGKLSADELEGIKKDYAELKDALAELLKKKPA